MKNYFSLLLFMLCPFLIFAQLSNDDLPGDADDAEREAPVKKSTHLAFHMGLSNYLGDLGGNGGSGNSKLSDNNFKKNTAFYGFSLTHYRREVLGFRLDYTSGKIAGSDQDTEFGNYNDDAYYRYKRNLNFQTKITEGSLVVELFPLKLLNYSKAVHHWDLQPYLMLGLGIYKFNPQGSYFDEIADDYVWVDLQPLRTEGQGMSEYPESKPYKLTQVNIPFGLGIKYHLSDKTAIAFEFQGRKLTTDYLDDVSRNFIDPALFSSYLDEEDAELARILNNKSNVIDPDNPYLPGATRGDKTDKDFYYSFNIQFSIRISKMKKNKSSAPGKKIYKYDNDELCFYSRPRTDLK